MVCRVAFAILLFVHGFAHLVGFVVPWRIATLKEMPHRTTLFAGCLDIGERGIRAGGLLWLIAAVAFAASGLGVILRAPWSLPFTAIVVGCSVLLCVAGWPDSRIGVFVNIGVAVGAVLLFSRHFGWFT